ncbi:MAG: hypothetical protein CL417_04540 [Acidimicrobiaceae bacterium]|nr:hypothetical protein [Acidimicrobiaceae bacterium]
MSSRIEIEITSEIDDQQYTWRALGAREPKGTIKKSLLPAKIKIGDEFRVEADFLIDGIEILRVLPKRDERKGQETIEILGSRNENYGVTTQLVKKKRNKKNSRSRKNQKQNTQKTSKDQRPKRDAAKKPRQSRSPQRGKRLKAKRSHRNSVIDNLPDLHKPLAREVLSRGIPNLRKTLNNMELPQGFDVEILQYAEKINKQLKTAEWRDRADAVLKSAKDIDLRDFRSVVAAGGQWANSDELSSIQSQLETSLRERIDFEHQQWLSEIKKAIEDGKSVRALNLSSHPPKPGTPLPENLMGPLVDLANNSLDSDTGSHRWSVVVQAVAFSPIRLKVTPKGIPERISDELVATIKKLSDRIPNISGLFTDSLKQTTD